MQLDFQMTFLTIQEEFMKIKQDMMILITISLSQDGENKIVPNIGWLEILGEVIGVKEEILESFEELQY